MRGRISETSLVSESTNPSYHEQGDGDDSEQPPMPTKTYWKIGLGWKNMQNKRKRRLCFLFCTHSCGDVLGRGSCPLELTYVTLLPPN